MHYKAITEIVNSSNIYVVDLNMDSSKRRIHNYIAFGKYPSKFNRIKRWLQGNSMYIENCQINECCELIEREKIDCVFVETSNVGNIVKKIKKKCPQIRVITFYHDIEAFLFRQWRKNKKSIVDKIETTIALRQEKLSANFSDLNICFHQRDVALFKQAYGDRAILNIPIATTIPQISDNCKKRVTGIDETKTILFVGTSYFPNILGLRWFMENVFPQLIGNFQIQIVGRGLDVLRKEFSDERIKISGFVDSLQSFYESADIVIAPIFIGGGMKAKTAEALSYGKNFLGTPESLVGYWEELSSVVKNSVVFCEDSSQEWIIILNGLISSEVEKYNIDLGEEFGCKFSFDVLKNNLNKVLVEK